MAQVKKFSNGIVTSVALLGKGNRQILEIGEDDILAIPRNTTPNAFCLILHTEERARIVFSQKNVGLEKGGYNGSFSEISILGRQIFSPPIQVMRVGENVWTSWHQERPNRMDCWLVGIDGRLELFQVGVITNDDGQTFRLLGEPRWQGQIFWGGPAGLVAKPDEPKWGSLLWGPNESRAAIREHPDFRRLLAGVMLKKWAGTPDQLDPPLGPTPPGKFARVDWYIPFAGQKGQGIVKLADGSSAWVHGQDFTPEDADGIGRLFHNDLVSYVVADHNWGTKKDGPPKLLGVRKVAEDKAPINPR